MTTSDPAGITFEVDEKLYPLEAVQSAVYAFTDRAYVRVTRPRPDRLEVSLKPKAGAASFNGELRGEFDNELMHQILRHRLSASNQKIREFIVTKALVSAQPAASVQAAVPAAPASEAPCPECAQEAPAPAAAAKVDEALEKEIDRLLSEIEAGGEGTDPLGVAVPWEDKFGGKDDGKKASEAKAPPKAKSPRKSKGS